MDRTERYLRAGLALYTAGEYHAAHDPWEHRWLELGADDAETGGADSPDRRLLQGLIQTAAAIHHARTGNWEGASGLAESARGYLGGLGATHRDVSLDPVRTFLATVAVTPEAAERDDPVAIDFDGTPVDAATEGFETVALCVEALVEEYDLDEATVGRAIEYGRADLDDGRASSPFVSLLVDLVGGGNRALVVKRLGDHVDRREHRESGVEGLFDVE
ncbi:DUF309 domain-containing protein [Halomarina oriensis]|uniref:DUF309 domain-containing protein n=1 Tax=Halomarina oriensis TaxID=671145 RepID=A0A6B0GHU0_9EURY|nr:DUF309 domain-containing protein [Halomarina oriensis]MWG32989.1 DUF309 domain-containing protein [Halomarina oriensis]